MKADDCTLSRDQWEKLIEQWVFNERNRAILKRRLLDAVTFDRLAEEFDLSVTAVKKIVYKCTDAVMKRV